METLTVRQAEILEFIVDYRERNGFPPSIREIGDGIGGAPSTVAYQLGQLRLKGRLRWHPKVPRSYVVVDPPVEQVAR